MINEKNGQSIAQFNCILFLCVDQEVEMIHS